MTPPNRFRFRFWDSKSKRMTDDYLIDGMDGEVLDRYGGSLWPKIDYDVKILQFTGLLDRNQKEIFEGDILSNRDYVINPGNATAVVKWRNGGFGFDILRLEELSINSVLALPVQIDGEVIGNIYEHPELLK